MILTTLLSLTLLAQAATLPGSNLTVEQANEKATVVFVAEYSKAANMIVGLGAVSFATIGMTESEVLKGELKKGDLDQVGVSASGYEVIPTKGVEYVVFIEKYKTHYTIVKMLPKTAENIEAVKKEIKAGKKP